MTPLEFSIPYNGKQDSLEDIFALKKLGVNRVKDVYLSGPQEFSAAARIMPKLAPDEFYAVVDSIHAEGIGVNLLMNSVCEGGGWYLSEVIEDKMAFIARVRQRCGVEAMTIANPLYIKEVKRRFPDIKIYTSVLSAVNSLQRALYFRELGADVIIAESNINRDLDLLRLIKQETGAELELIVNQGCLYECPFERFHASFVSHKSIDDSGADSPGEILGVFFRNCSGLVQSHPDLIFKSPWIRPEDTRRYQGITDTFKITGRSNPKWAAISRAYLQESWDGNLFDLMDASIRYFARARSAYIPNKALEEHNFFDRVTACHRQCHQCRYCQDLASAVISYAAP